MNDKSHCKPRDSPGAVLFLQIVGLYRQIALLCSRCTQQGPVSPVLMILLAFAFATCEGRDSQFKEPGEPEPPPSHPLPTPTPAPPVPLLTQGEQDSSDAQERRTDHPAQLQAFPV